MKWLLVVAPVFYIASYFVRDQIPFNLDTAWNIYAIQRWFWTQVLEHGEWPLWNEFLFNGYSYFGSPTHEVYSPLVSPFYLLPSFWPAIATITLALILGMWGTFELAGQFTKESHLRLAAALAYGFLGPILSVIDRSTLLCAAALYPWIAYSTILMMKRAKLGNSVIWAILLTGIFLHADWAGGAAAVGLVLVIAVVHPATSRWWTGIGCALGIALLLSASVFLPVSENVSYTSRAQGLRYSEISEWSLSPLRILQQVAPELWGNPHNKSFWGKELLSGPLLTEQFWFHSLYLSIPVLLLALLGIWNRRRDRLTWAMMAISLFLFLLALGQNFALHPWLSENVSALAKFRYPEKFVLFPILIGFAYFVYALSIYAKAEKETLSRFWIAVAGMHLIAPIILVFMTQDDSFPETVTQALAQAQIFHLLLAGAAVGIAVCFHYSKSKISVPVQKWGLAVFVVADLLAFSPNLKTMKWSEYTDSFRLAEHAPFAAAKGRWVIDRSDFFNTDTPQTLTRDWGLLAGFRILTAYDSIFPNRLPNSIMDVWSSLPIWADVLNIQYILTADKPRSEILKTWESKKIIEQVHGEPEFNIVVYQVIRDPAEFSMADRVLWVGDSQRSIEEIRSRASLSGQVILESSEAHQDSNPLSIAQIAEWQSKVRVSSFGEQGKIEIVSHSHNQREVTVRTASPGWLIFRQSYHIGWSGKVNGRSVPLFHANFSNTAIPIESSGESRIQLSFRSPAWTLGLIISMFGVLLGTAILCLPRWRNSKL